MARTPAVVRRTRRRVPVNDSLGGSSTSGSVPLSGSPRDIEGEADLSDSVPELDEVREAQTSNVANGFDIPDHLDPRPLPESRGNSVDDIAPDEILSNYSGDGKRMMRRKMVLKSMLRDLPRSAIAQQLGVSERTVDSDMAYIRKEAARQVKDIDIYSVVAKATMVNQEVLTSALRLLSDNKVTSAVKIAAMRTALVANADQLKTYKLTGVLDALPFIPTTKNDLSDMELLAHMTKQILSDGVDDDDAIAMDLAESVKILNELGKDDSDEPDFRIV